MSLSTSHSSVRSLQQALHARAEEEPSFRFYTLYDKICRMDVLSRSWEKVRKKKGAPGIDGVTIRQIEEDGVESWLQDLAAELKEKSYRPASVRRVYIPKPGGKRRPLGIPTVKDRVVQQAAVLVLGPIFESDLEDEQYAYRPGRSAHDAVRRVHSLLNRGYTNVVDADLKSYFDQIPHRQLMKSLARRISDGSVLALLKSWLLMPIEETDEEGRARRTNPAREHGRGTPQGAPISPLLANIYLRRFIRAWKVTGCEEDLQAKVVCYADDCLILCRGSAKEAHRRMELLMDRLGLPLNEEKTTTVTVPDEAVSFLGYRIGRTYSRKTGQAYIGTWPAKEKVQRLCREISELTGPQTQSWSLEKMVQVLNRKLRGWTNYFCLGPVSKAYRAVDQHTHLRVAQWLSRKRTEKGTGLRRYPAQDLYERWDLVELNSLTRGYSWNQA